MFWHKNSMELRSDVAYLAKDINNALDVFENAHEFYKEYVEPFECFMASLWHPWIIIMLSLCLSYIIFGNVYWKSIKRTGEPVGGLYIVYRLFRDLLFQNNNNNMSHQSDVTYNSETKNSSEYRQPSISEFQLIIQNLKKRFESSEYSNYYLDSIEDDAQTLVPQNTNDIEYSEVD